MTFSSGRAMGAMPEAEQKKLRDYVKTAHTHGRLVRFWATPEKQVVWTELADAGVDLIGTDDLPGLRSFLLAREVQRPGVVNGPYPPAITPAGGCLPPPRLLRPRLFGRRLIGR